MRKSRIAASTQLAPWPQCPRWTSHRLNTRNQKAAYADEHDPGPAEGQQHDLLGKLAATGALERDARQHKARDKQERPEQMEEERDLFHQTVPFSVMPPLLASQASTTPGHSRARALVRHPLRDGGPSVLGPCPPRARRLVGARPEGGIRPAAPSGVACPTGPEEPDLHATLGIPAF